MAAGGEAGSRMPLYISEAIEQEQWREPPGCARLSPYLVQPGLAAMKVRIEYCVP